MVGAGSVVTQNVPKDGSWESCSIVSRKGKYISFSDDQFQI